MAATNLPVISVPDAGGHAADRGVIFRPIAFKSGLEVKNRLFRSSISGQFDDYNGHGSNARLNWEEQFAAGGIGANLSAVLSGALDAALTSEPVWTQERAKIKPVFWAKDELGPDMTQTVGVVTDAEPFLRALVNELEKD